MGVGPVIVLDTHAFVWWLGAPDRLPRKARTRLDRAVGEGDTLRVSTISAWEVAMLVARGRLELTMEVGAWLAAAEALPSLEFVPVSNAVALRAVALPDTFPRDLADRIIAATALGLGATLVTGDERLQHYRPLPTLWS
ncbi:MAG TPA: type II toxin-antitoxin system VapC family toxin [Gemmatimonadales bacterium]